jgi:uncharacterized iron-regulated protein
MSQFLLNVRVLTLFLLLCCNTASMAQAHTGPGETLYDLQHMQKVHVHALITAMSQADVSVLGEIHDNPRHHGLRADLLRMLPKPDRTIVAEHLTYPLQMRGQAELLQGLKAAGFDDKGWNWPMHQPLFATINELGLPMWGGNISKGDSKSIFNTKGESTSPDLRALLAKATLGEASRQDLHREIDEGHCGAMPANMFDSMVAVQRARDASMAHAALQHLPAVVLAGNGHAWKHLGVPQIIRANRPELKVVSVLFLEHAPFATESEAVAWIKRWAGKADFVWLGPEISRPDPCLSFKSQK